MKIQNPKRKIDSYFDDYDEQSSKSINRIIQCVCGFGIYFSILGISWSVPFPHLIFLGQYNSYFNWASFVIAFSIYYYSKLSPLLSYLMLFLALVFTYLITLIAKQYPDNSFGLTQLYVTVFIVFEFIRSLSLKIAGKRSTLKTEFLFIWIGPIWVLHFLLKRFSVKY